MVDWQKVKAETPEKYSNNVVIDFNILIVPYDKV